MSFYTSIQKLPLESVGHVGFFFLYLQLVLLSFFSFLLTSKIRPAEDLVVFVDPARLGMDKAVISALIKLNPRKIVYMSCNPETAVRDVKYLTANSNYKLTEVSPYNMFPYTKHIELLACLQKQE